MMAAFYPMPTWIPLVVLGGACLLVRNRFGGNVFGSPALRTEPRRGG